MPGPPSQTDASPPSSTAPRLWDTAEHVAALSERLDRPQRRRYGITAFNRSDRQLRHTGVRAEELLEITHLALVSYRLPDTGEIVPLLQIVPSKSNEERLLLVSPELASVLASIVKRLRDANNGVIPLEPRYDPQEKTTSPPLPHLFQRKIGWRPSVISATQVKRLLTEAIVRAGLRDVTGQPLHYPPHDFRSRLFTTEAVTGGLPVRIAAKLLGHHNIATVESYLAVFQDELIRTYRAFLDKRRAARPESEYREPTDQEWQEFQQHPSNRGKWPSEPVVATTEPLASTKMRVSDAHSFGLIQPRSRDWRRSTLTLSAGSRRQRSRAGWRRSPRSRPPWPLQFRNSKPCGPQPRNGTPHSWGCPVFAPTPERRAQISDQQ